MAELIGLDPELLDDLKTAVSEACNNVVMHAYDGETGPLGVRMYIDPEAIEVVVEDQGSGLPPLAPADETIRGVGLVGDPRARRAGGVPRDARGRDRGADVVRRPARRQAAVPPAKHGGPGRPWTDRGCPGTRSCRSRRSASSAGVLGRVARALAARARFSLDRFSDVYLVTDAIAAHAGRAAKGARLSFAISTDAQRLELTIGPFVDGSGGQLSHQAPDYSAASALAEAQRRTRGPPRGRRPRSCTS